MNLSQDTPRNTLKITQLQKYLPYDWEFRNYEHEDYALIEIPRSSSTYRNIESSLEQNFNLGIKKIVRVQNPYLYLQFEIKKLQYAANNNGVPPNIIKLYHDTAEVNINSIASNNLDWRKARRVKYGKGVSFSSSPSYANQLSNNSNGTDRAMIIADVLTYRIEHVNDSKLLPSDGYDTTVANNGQVSVKYYDDEFYPTFVAFYKSKPQVHYPFKPRRRFL